MSDGDGDMFSDENEGSAGASETGFRMRFWDFICGYERLIKIALGINLALFTMLLLASPGISPGTGSYVIFVVDLAISIPLILVTIYFLWRCRNHERVGEFNREE